MKYPLVVFEKDCDVMVYFDLKKAELDHEVIDVKNNEYAAFDAEGRVLNFKIEKNKVRIEETSSFQPEKMKEKLIDFIIRARKIERTMLSKLSLSELIRLGNNG